MSTTIGGVTLDNEVIWADEYQFNDVAGVADRAISGEMVLQAFVMYRGQPLTLVGDDSHGWQTKNTVNLLKALALAKVGQSFTVSFRNNTYTCVFRYEEPPTVDFSPVIMIENPSNETWYTGSIKLRIVA